MRFLEDRGDIPVVDDVERIGAHLAAFAREIEDQGYSRSHRGRYPSQAEHFACWLRLNRIRWRDADGAVVERFARHDCRCPIRRKRGRLVEPTGSASRRRGARRFLGFLRERGAIPAAVVSRPVEDPRLSAFREWLKRHRGATDETVRRYLYEASRWLPALGSDPAAYDAATVRRIVLDQEPQRSRCVGAD